MSRSIAMLVVVGCVCTSAGAQNPPPPAAPASHETVAVHRARVLRAQHQFAKAADLLQTYLAVHGDDADALTLLAQIKVDAGDKQAGQQLLSRALNASPNSPTANLLAGQMLLDAQQYPEAMDRFETALVALPKDQEARKLETDAANKLAAQAQAAGNQEAALAVFDHVRTKLPDSPELLLSLGSLAFNLHKLPEAEEAFRAARALRPRDPNTVYALARVEIEEQHMPAAETDLRSYLAERPKDASAHFGLGHIYAMEQRDAEARAEFERSIQLQPLQTESYYQVGQLDLDAHKDSEAEPLFLRVIARDPKHGGALAGLGEIAFRAKAYPQAEEYLRRAVQAAPDYAPAHYYYGLLLARLGRKPEADAELALATKLGHDAGNPVSATQEQSRP